MRCLKNHFRQGAKIQWFPLVSAAWKDEPSFTFTKTVILFKSCRGRSNTTRRPQAHYFLDLLALFLELFLPVDLGQHVGIPKLFPFSHQWERLLSTLRTIAIVPGTETPATTKKTFARPCTLNLTGVKLHCGLKRLLIGHLLSNADDKKLVWINSHKHAMLTQCGAWTLMRREADTWPQSLPGLPLAALTVTSSKAASRDRGLTLPSPSKKLFRVITWSAHFWTFNNFQLPNVGTSAASESESESIVKTTQLAFCPSGSKILALAMPGN